MSNRIEITPPSWHKELTFEEFKHLNSNKKLNENQLINLYNQYLAKYLTELTEQKINFKLSLQNQLQTEVKKMKHLRMFDDYIQISSPGSIPATSAGAASFTYSCNAGIGCYAVGVYLGEDGNTSLDTPIDEGVPRFTVGPFTHDADK